MKNSIVLIGMPAAGKSTIGVVLAKCGCKSFVDTDLIIQNEMQSKLQDIIDNNGIEYFLKIEEDILLEQNFGESIIATGGSVIYSDKVMEKLNKIGTVVYLELDLETIKKRLNDINTRGIAMSPNKKIEDIYLERKPLYEKYAEITIKSKDKTVEEIVEEIINLTFSS